MKLFTQPLMRSLLLVSMLGQVACGSGEKTSPTPFIPSTPTPSTPANTPPTISGAVPVAQEDQHFSFTPAINDADNDALVVTVVNLPSWLSYNNANYSISGTPTAIDLGESGDITYRVTDGSDSAEMRFRIQVGYNNLKQALRTGDYRYVDNGDTFIESAQSAVDKVLQEAQGIKRQLFNLGPNGQAKSDGSSLTDISWNPTHDAGHLLGKFGINHELLVSNATFGEGYELVERVLGIVGEQAGPNRQARFLALGSNPMRNSYRNASLVNEDMHQFFKNSIAWLVGWSRQFRHPAS